MHLTGEDTVMFKNGLLLIGVVGLSVVAACEMPNYRVGRSATIQFGTVRTAEQVTLNSAAAQGALIGGTLGVVAGRGSSSMGNAIKGATLGGAATAIAEGDRTGMSFTVDMPDGSSTRIISDQREIHTGDCVAVERVGSSANIRRVTSSYCDPANAQAVRAVDASMQSEALKCQSAKQELADAANDAEADLATRKIELLCYG